MNEQLHTDCSILQNKLPAVLPVNINLSTKVRASDFLKQIVQRYAVNTKSDRFPLLIFLRLLETTSGITKLTNINRFNVQKILNTNIRQQLELYSIFKSEQNITDKSHFNNVLSSGRYAPEQQVNIRTDLAKDVKHVKHAKYATHVKHVEIPRLMSYLQRIDNQNQKLGSVFQSVATKTLVTTKLSRMLRTLPGEVVSQRQRSENTVLFPSNHYFESEKIKARDDGGIRNTSDIISHPPIHMQEDNPKIDAVRLPTQKIDQLVCKTHEGFSKQIAARYLVTEKNKTNKTNKINKTNTKNGTNNIVNKLISNSHIAKSNLVNAEVEGKTEFGEVIKNTEMLFGQDSVLLQHAEHAQTGLNGSLNSSLFDEYTNPTIADIPRVGVSENTKARDFIFHPPTHAQANNPKIGAMMAHIQKRNELVYEKHEGFSTRTVNRYLVTGKNKHNKITEKNNIANKLISNTHIARAIIQNVEVEGEPEVGEVMQVPQVLQVSSNQGGVSLHHVGHVQTSMSGSLNIQSNIPLNIQSNTQSNTQSNNIVRSSSNLVFRNIAVDNTGEGRENIAKPDIIKTESSKINVDKSDIVGTHVQARDRIDDIATISNIADKVYKLLETRISIEKERRGIR